MTFDNLNGIEKAGFVGFKRMSELFIDSSTIPKTKGVYLILKPDRKAEFVKIGTGGHFKGKNPNVPADELNGNWVNDSIVVYIGKAGKAGTSATLQSRLRQYLKFGQGRNIGHYGGRLIWQLKDSRNLIVCWKTLPNDDPRMLESELIQQFTSHYGKRPFANLNS